MIGVVGLIIFTYREPWTWTDSSVGQIWRLLGLAYVPGKVSGTALYSDLVFQKEVINKCYISRNKRLEDIRGCC